MSQHQLLVLPAHHQQLALSSSTTRSARSRRMAAKGCHGRQRASSSRHTPHRRALLCTRASAAGDSKGADDGGRGPGGFFSKLFKGELGVGQGLFDTRTDDFTRATAAPPNEPLHWLTLPRSRPFDRVTERCGRSILHLAYVL